MAIFLYVNTGSVNHGCEAIVRSTCSLLERVNPGQKKVLVTSNIEQDKAFHLEEKASLLGVGHWKNQYQRIFYNIRRIFRDVYSGYDSLYGNFLRATTKRDLALCIGGDTYCYTYPYYLEYCLDNLKRRNVACVLWGTSIEEDKISARMLQHLKRYDLIVARESITYNTLLQHGIDSQKIVLTCDPAFWLEMKKTALPDCFAHGDVIGVNISGLVTGMDTQKTKNAYKSVKLWLQNILQSAKYQICLIPHCYGKNAFGLDDLYYANKLYEEFTDEEKRRISVVSQEMSCSELKYIISKCRFYVGARTHSVIAAYSTGVPAIALGYSVKSKGIALDIFGTTTNYVLDIEALQNSENLMNAFGHLVKNEENIKRQYREILPEYKEKIVSAAKQTMALLE